jgi:hypothetical protein
MRKKRGGGRGLQQRRFLDGAIAGAERGRQCREGQRGIAEREHADHATPRVDRRGRGLARRRAGGGGRTGPGRQRRKLRAGREESRGAGPDRRSRRDEPGRIVELPERQARQPAGGAECFDAGHRNQQRGHKQRRDTSEQQPLPGATRGRPEPRQRHQRDPKCNHRRPARHPERFEGAVGDPHPGDAAAGPAQHCRFARGRVHRRHRKQPHHRTPGQQQVCPRHKRGPSGTTGGGGGGHGAGEFLARGRRADGKMRSARERANNASRTGSDQLWGESGWCRQRDSNPCCGLERAASWTGLDDGDTLAVTRRVSGVPSDKMMVSVEGIEPSTNRLKVCCSTG